MLNVAVVGYGHIGKRHCNNVMENPETELVAVCDPYIDSKDLPKENIWWHDFNEMMQTYLTYESEHTLDLIVIATPNHLHYEMVKRCLEAKIPVLAEKPLTLKTDESLELIRISEENNVPIFVNYPLRFLESVWTMKKAVNKIGSPRIIQLNALWNRNENYYDSDWRGLSDMEGGPMFNEFIHHLNLIKYLFGDIKNIEGNTYDFAHDYTEVEDTGIINFQTKEGGVGNMIYTVACPNQSFDVSLTVIGSKGSFKLSGLYLNELLIDGKMYEYEINLEHFSDVLESVRLYLEEDYLDNRLCNIYEATSDIKDIEAFYESSKIQTKTNAESFVVKDLNF